MGTAVVTMGVLRVPVPKLFARRNVLAEDAAAAGGAAAVVVGSVAIAGAIVALVLSALATGAVVARERRLPTPTKRFSIVHHAPEATHPPSQLAP